MSTFVKRYEAKTSPVSTLENNNILKLFSVSTFCVWYNLKEILDGKV